MEEDTNSRRKVRKTRNASLTSVSAEDATGELIVESVTQTFPVCEPMDDDDEDYDDDDLWDSPVGAPVAVTPPGRLLTDVEPID